MQFWSHPHILFCIQSQPSLQSGLTAQAKSSRNNAECIRCQEYHCLWCTTGLFLCVMKVCKCIGLPNLLGSTLWISGSHWVVKMFIKVGNKFRRIVVADYRILQMALQQMTVATQRPTASNSSHETLLWHLLWCQCLSASKWRSHCSEVKGKIYEHCVNMCKLVLPSWFLLSRLVGMLSTREAFARGNLEILQNLNPFITLYHFGSGIHVHSHNASNSSILTLPKAISAAWRNHVTKPKGQSHGFKCQTVYIHQLPFLVYQIYIISCHQSYIHLYIYIHIQL